MTDRHTVNTITSDALDALYEQIEAAEATESQRQLATAQVALASATTRAAHAEAVLTRIAALADEYPAGIDTALIHEALDQPPGPAATQATDGPGLYDKLTAMFSGPLPRPGDTPPSTVLGCSLHQLRRTHGPHRWQPQPGMRPVQCPGWEHVPAAADTPLAAAFRDCLAAFDGMRNTDGTGPVERWQARVTPREYETWQTTAQAAGQAAAGVHVYLSTGCLHGDHDYCKAMTGLNGAKRPGSCKHCGAKCTCGCHDEPGPA